MTFATKGEILENTCPYQYKNEFISSNIKGMIPTLLSKDGKIVNEYIINLVDIFPTNKVLRTGKYQTGQFLKDYQPTLN